MVSIDRPRVSMRRQQSHSSIRLIRATLAMGALATLSACADPASLALSGISAVTFAHSGKTVTDHVMSLATEQDCSLQHSLDGKAWCLPIRNAAYADEGGPNANAAPVQYCYRSIAAVTCYRQQNPHDTVSRRTNPPQLPRTTEIAGKAETIEK